MRQLPAAIPSTASGSALLGVVLGIAVFGVVWILTGYIAPGASGELRIGFSVWCGVISAVGSLPSVRARRLTLTRAQRMVGTVRRTAWLGAGAMMFLNGRQSMFSFLALMGVIILTYWAEMVLRAIQLGRQKEQSPLASGGSE